MADVIVHDEDEDEGLEPYQFLYINTRRGWMYRTTAPELKHRAPAQKGRR